MKDREITVSKEANGKIQYLTEILPEIPTNTILYKKLTGLGATYGELKAHRNSIIIEPNKPVISGKCKDPKHGKDNLFGVFDGVYADDIVAYMERSIKQSKHFKILTTPESFHKVQEHIVLSYQRQSLLSVFQAGSPRSHPTSPLLSGLYRSLSRHL